MVAHGACGGAATEQGYRLANARLVAVAEIGEAFERIFEAAIGAHGKSVKAALLHVVELIAEHVADRA
jgi:hypothetical protein